MFCYWCKFQVYSISKAINETFIEKTFIETFEACNIDQLVDFPTRGSNTLDILGTNRPTFCNRCIPKPGISDHDTIVLADIACHTLKSKPNERKIFIWSRTDIPQLKNHVSMNVNTFINKNTINTPVNDIWFHFKDLVESSRQFIPSKVFSRRYSQPWFNRECKRLTRKKKRAYNRAKRTNLISDWNKFKKLSVATRKSCKNEYNCFVQDSIAPNFKNNSKKFFSFIKSKKCDDNGIAPLRDQGKTYTDDIHKANILNKQFGSVFTTDDSLVPNSIFKPVNVMPDINIEVYGVKKLLSELNENKASGPDNVEAKFLKFTGNELSPALTLVFQASLSQGIIPDDWRHAFVNPLYKAGKSDKGLAENYRPISLTSVSCKILEHIIVHNVMQHFEKQNVLTNAQHGFRKKRSCDTQLVQTVNDFAKTLNDSKQSDVILLDFSKAFDKVNHRKLCLKLEHYGVQGTTLKWIIDFLHNRTQSVVINGKKSDSISVKSGVP